MTKPPCGNGIDDCPRRCVGCRADCDEWREWLAIHEEESAAAYAKRHENTEYNEYTAALIERRQRRSNRRRDGRR